MGGGVADSQIPAEHLKKNKSPRKLHFLNLNFTFRVPKYHKNI